MELVMVNEAGVTLLSFCTLNGLSIMKKDMYKYIWQYPGTRKWYCIDYILMCQGQRKFCRDLSVLRRADCHKFLRAKVLLRSNRSFPQRSETSFCCLRVT